MMPSCMISRKVNDIYTINNNSIRGANSIHKYYLNLTRVSPTPFVSLSRSALSSSVAKMSEMKQGYRQAKVRNDEDA